MTPDSLIDEIRARLQLSEGTPTLLLVIAESNGVLPDARGLLLSILRASSVDVNDLGAVEKASGPARWAEKMRAQPAPAFALSFVPSNPLSTAAFARLLNSEREILRRLAGPLLLFVSRDTERDLRKHAPDFFTWVAQGYELPSLRDLESIAARYSPPGALTAPTPPREDPIRFLHISDIHLRPTPTKRYDQDRVLDGLLAYLEREKESFPLDVIFVTGDLAQSGSQSEYELVSDLLRKIMAVTKVPSERVFVVPGNHDVDREIGRFLLRTLSKDEDSVAFFTEPRNRMFHEQKLSAYKQAMGALLGESRPHGLGVGEGAVEIIDVRGNRLAVATFNSAWFAQGDDDQGKLWLGEPNVERALDRIADSDVLFAIAMMHHPFDYLHEAERDVVERWFERGFDLVLRGHLHADKTRSIASQRGGYVEVASPAAYQGSQWANGCFLGEIRPRGRKVRLRPLMYSSGPDPWVIDSRVFPDDEKDGYCHEFIVPEKKRLPSATAKTLRKAAEQAVKSASPASRLEITRALESRAFVQQREDGAPQSAAAARILSDSPELWTEILGRDGSGVALVLAITQEGQKEPWRSRRVSYRAQGAFEQVLTTARALFLKICPKTLLATLPEQAVLSGLATALSASVDAGVWTQPAVGALRPDIVIGPPGAGGWVIELKRAARKGSQSSGIQRGLAQLDSYLTATGAWEAALVLFGATSTDMEEPRIERVKTQSGRDVFLMKL